MIQLALVSGTAFDDWADQEWRVIATALDILDKKNRTDDQGRLMSG